MQRFRVDMEYRYEPLGECVYKYKLQGGYSTVYHEKVLHNYFIRMP